MPKYVWKTVWSGYVEPGTTDDYGMIDGGHCVLQEFQRERRTKSKGWRRHLRRDKSRSAVQRRAERVPAEQQ